MALTAQAIPRREAQLYYEPDVADTVLGPDTAKTVYAVYVNNIANSVAYYFKMWDALVGGVTLGDTAPIVQYKVPAGAARLICLGMGDGLAFGTSPSFAVVDDAGDGAADPDGPTSDVPVTLFTD